MIAEDSNAAEQRDLNEENLRLGASGLELVPCGLCGSARYTLLLAANTTGADLVSAAYACTSPSVGRHLDVVSCDSCGLVYANPRPTPELVGRLYGAVEDSAYLEEEGARVATFRHSLLGVRRREPGGRLLDVGAHVGTFLGVARERGYEVAGVEPSGWAAGYARRERGLEVFAGALADAPLEPGSFDVVTLWDVVEHFPDPLGELRRIGGLLRPGGLLALTTMDVGARLPRLLGGRWPWYMLMHLYYFTPRTMSTMLEAAGFEVVEVGRHTRIAHLGYIVSKLEAYSPGLHRVARSLVGGLGLGGVRIPVDLGDLMTVYARRVYGCPTPLAPIPSDPQ